MKCAFVDLGRHYGGAETYLVSLISAWIDAGNEALVVVKNGSEFAKKIRDIFGEKRMICVDYNHKDIRNTRKLLIKDSVDVVHINGINSGLFTWFARIRIPKVTTVHSNAEMDRIEKPFILRKLFVLAENICLKRTNRIIVVSEAIKQGLVSRNIHRKNIITINNGIQIMKYPNRVLRNDSNKVLKICYVGRLEEVKGCEYLLRALKLCEGFNISCDIYGEGSQKNDLEELIKTLNIENMVCLMGYSNIIRDILPDYDVLVMPSLFEASPLTIPEAMNAKTLVVASEVGGIPFLITNKKNGYMFPAKDYNKLANILKEICLNPNEQQELIENAYEDFINNYTFDVMRDRTFNVFREAKCDCGL